jgi:glutathione S-transferase
MKLIYAPVSPYARKCRIIAIEATVAHELLTDNPNVPESIVGQFNPLGKVPALILDDGQCIFDSIVICEYFARNSATLIPAEFNARIDAKVWEAIGDGICDAALAARMEGLRKEITEESKVLIARQRGKISAALAFAAKRLGEKTLCVGSQFTLADAAMIAALGYLSTRFPDIDWRGTHPNLARFMDAHAQRKSVVESAPVL